jgi:uncharacterized membrane protein
LSIETSRILGLIGALLMFVGIIPYINFFGVIEIVGLILVMIALYTLSGYYKEQTIFNNALYGLIMGIVGTIISVVVVVVTILTSLTDFLQSIFPDWNGEWTALSGLTPDPSNLSLDSIAPIIVGILTVLLVLWIFSIIAAFFVRRSFGALAEKSGIGLFSTTGLIILIGAVLIVAFGIGLILIWISALLLAIAFYQLKPQQT